MCSTIVEHLGTVVHWSSRGVELQNNVLFEALWVTYSIMCQSDSAFGCSHANYGPHGGPGYLLSIGIFRKISYSRMRTCLEGSKQLLSEQWIPIAPPGPFADCKQAHLEPWMSMLCSSCWAWGLGSLGDVHISMIAFWCGIPSSADEAKIWECSHAACAKGWKLIAAAFAERDIYLARCLWKVWVHSSPALWWRSDPAASSHIHLQVAVEAERTKIGNGPLVWPKQSDDNPGCPSVDGLACQL